MIQGRDNLIEWFKMQCKPYFAILRKGKEESGNVFATNKAREGENMETASHYLQQCLNIIQSGDFLIYCAEAPDKTSSKGRSETFFSINLNDTQRQSAPAVSGIGGPAFDYETMMQKAGEMAEKRFEELQTKAKLKEVQDKCTELAKENKDLQQKISDPWNKVINTVAPHIGAILQSTGVIPATPAVQGVVSGVDDHEDITDNSTMTTEQLERMNAVVNEFCSAISHQYPANWLDIVEKLTNAIKNEPAKIDMALKFL
jgi:hypothetical protein